MADKIYTIRLPVESLDLFNDGATVHHLTEIQALLDTYLVNIYNDLIDPDVENVDDIATDFIVAFDVSWENFGLTHDKQNLVLTVVASDDATRCMSCRIGVFGIDYFDFSTAATLTAVEASLKDLIDSYVESLDSLDVGAFGLTDLRVTKSTPPQSQFAQRLYVFTGFGIVEPPTGNWTETTEVAVQIKPHSETVLSDTGDTLDEKYFNGSIAELAGVDTSTWDNAYLFGWFTGNCHFQNVGTNEEEIMRVSILQAREYIAT